MEAVSSRLLKPWNKGKFVGQKTPLRLSEIWAIRVRLQFQGRLRDPELFAISGLDSTPGSWTAGSKESAWTARRTGRIRRRTKASLIYRLTKNLQADQLLLGHSKLKSTVRYFGIDVQDALELAEQGPGMHG